MKLVSEQLCTGCFACRSACPFEAINVIDKGGFKYPTVDNQRCKNCGKCEKVCPVHNYTKDTNTNPSLFAAKSKDSEIQKSSSSGGIFALLGQSVIKDGGVVFGAYLDKDLVVKHGSANSNDGLEKFMGSKYVQSFVGPSYIEVERHLKKGTKVLFSGTPCQIYGLKSFLGRYYDNLITIDFICHGVPSPLAWKSYVDYQEKTNNSKIVSGSFRDKTEGWKNYSLRLFFENGTQYRKVNPIDPYLHAFVYNIMLRESCYNCFVKANGYVSDITLSDFWGVKRFNLAIEDCMGVSAVLINSEKGRALYSRIQEQVINQEVPREYIEQVNPSIKKQTPMNPYRQYFLDTLIKYGFIQAYRKWVGDSLNAKISRKMVDFRQRLEQ